MRSGCQLHVVRLLRLIAELPDQAKHGSGAFISHGFDLGELGSIHIFERTHEIENCFDFIERAARDPEVLTELLVAGATGALGLAGSAAEFFRMPPSADQRCAAPYQARTGSCQTRRFDLRCDRPDKAPLFLMYTSGTTGKPRGCQHSTGG